jgi:hypothetical protein
VLRAPLDPASIAVIWASDNLDAEGEVRHVVSMPSSWRLSTWAHSSLSPVAGKEWVDQHEHPVVR